MSDINKPSDEKAGDVDDLWADALNEQKGTADSAEDLWADALSEQKTAGKSSADSVFRALEGGDMVGALQDINLIMDIPVKPSPNAQAAVKLQTTDPGGFSREAKTLCHPGKQQNKEDNQRQRAAYLD